MKRLLSIFYLILIIICLFLSSWFVLHNDIQFTSDIARDFFLLDELDQKTIVLIGPKTSSNLFHGPLWTYLNYPAYVIGDGNPVVIGWFWVVLVTAFIASSFYIGKKLFDSTTGYLFALMVSVYCVFHSNGLFNPHGAMFLLPAFFFFFIRYFQTLSLKYLITHLITAGFIIQFQMAVGIPFLILSTLAIIYKLLTTKKSNKKHILTFILVPFMLINFIAFDLKHDFIISKLLQTYILSPSRDQPNYIALLQERFWHMISSTELLRRDPGYRNLTLTLITFAFIFLQIKDNKYKTIYKSFLYFYVGFFLLSFINSGPLLYFYLFPLFPLVFLIFSSMITSRFKMAFIPLFLIVFAMNIHSAIDDIKVSDKFIGRDLESWKFLDSLAKKVYDMPDKEFGYFVYEPNVLAYGPKYAMKYESMQSNKKTYYFEKKPTTYLIIAPPPVNNPYMKDEWWRINQVRISASPSASLSFENGYKIEKYMLNDKEIETPFDTAIDPGLHFR